MNEVMQIGKMVQQFRKGCGLTQVGLGEAIGWKQPAICALERGKRKRLDIKDVKKIARALQIPPQRLLYSIEWDDTGEAVTKLEFTSALMEQLSQLDTWQQQKLIKVIIEITSAMKGKSSNDNN